MSFGYIPHSWSTMIKAYKIHNAINDGTNVGTEVHEWITKQNKYEAEHGLKKSTTCAMQASMAFNAVQPIPHQGEREDRNNLIGEKTGFNYILSVAEFNTYLSYTYGPTTAVQERKKIPPGLGIVLFGNGHVEFWDGFEIYQAPPLMTASWVWGQKPYYFWYIGDKPEAYDDWFKGWWTVYDTNYYYYFFDGQGQVVYIKQKPNPKWNPPMTVGNRGSVELIENGFKIRWNAFDGLAATVETFTLDMGYKGKGFGMNGTSNNYGPLYATKM